MQFCLESFTERDHLGSIGVYGIVRLNQFLSGT